MGISPDSERPKKGLGVKGKVGLTVAAAGTVAAGLFGVDQEAKPVSAEGPPTPPATATPTSIEKQIAELQAKAEALQKQRANEDKLAEIKARIAALEGSPTPTATKPIPTPTRIPAEATAAADAIRLKALGEEQARGKATATAEAKQTATAEAKTTPTGGEKAGGKSRSGQEGGGPWGIILALLAGATATTAVTTERGRSLLKQGRDRGVEFWGRRPTWMGGPGAGGTPPPPPPATP